MRRFSTSITKRHTLLMIFVGLVYGVLVISIYFIPGIAFGSYRDTKGQLVLRTSFLDWLELVLIPLFLVIGGVALNSRLQRLQRERVEKRPAADRKTAYTSRKAPHAPLEVPTLQSYFDRVTEMILKHQFDDPSLGAKAQRLARSWTLTTLPVLDAEGKGALLKFLYEANLITGDTPWIDLSEADFRQVNLNFAHLEGANFKQANFEGALITNAFLAGSNFSQANLKNASLIYSHLEDANSQFANLQNANLAYAHFGGANLHGAILNAANVEATDFMGANLTVARVTREQLARANLSNAILPDGSHYNAPSAPV